MVQKKNLTVDLKFTFYDKFQINWNILSNQVAFLRKPEIKFSLDPVDSLAGDWLRLVMISSSLFWLPRDWHGEQVQ